ncbi:MAG: flavodoxin family protein [Caldilineaceae bacterium]
MDIRIIYDSEFGNTARIAEAIAQGARTAAANADHVTLHHISDVQPEQVLAADLLVITRPPALSDRWCTLVEQAAATGLVGKAVAAFDTRFTEEEIKSIGRMLSTMVDLGYAAPRWPTAVGRACCRPRLLRRRQGRPAA